MRDILSGHAAIMCSPAHRTFCSGAHSDWSCPRASRLVRRTPPRAGWVGGPSWHARPLATDFSVKRSVTSRCEKADSTSLCVRFCRLKTARRRSVVSGVKKMQVRCTSQQGSCGSAESLNGVRFVPRLSTFSKHTWMTSHHQPRVMFWAD